MVRLNNTVHILIIPINHLVVKFEIYQIHTVLTAKGCTFRQLQTFLCRILPQGVRAVCTSEGMNANLWSTIWRQRQHCWQVTRARRAVRGQRCWTEASSRTLILLLFLMLIKAAQQMDNNLCHDYHQKQWLVTHTQPEKLIWGTLGDKGQL